MTPKAKKLAIRLSLEFEGEKGMDQFVQVLKLLYDNGHESLVKAAVKEIIQSARKHGAAVPPEIEAFCV